uniref:Phenylalanyl-tRNA synthetase domain-containing protein n=1 Tax=Glossina morsitans morsitans TaxID=37546 RepID=A0A1B0F992_GLOMM
MIAKSIYGAQQLFTEKRNSLFSVYDKLNLVITIQQNFDNLLIPVDHVSRSKADCYYVSQRYLLRAHTTAHQVDLISSGLDNFLVVGEVCRRDEIDSTHYPVFHQLDTVRLVTKDKLFERNPGLEIFETDERFILCQHSAPLGGHLFPVYTTLLGIGKFL